jgi:hypothetical protein
MVANCIIIIYFGLTVPYQNTICHMKTILRERINFIYTANCKGMYKAEIEYVNTDNHASQDIIYLILNDMKVTDINYV